MRAFSLAILILMLALYQVTAADKILFATDFSHGISNDWQNVSLYKGLTDYAVVHSGTNFYVHAAADNSCSALTHKLNLKPPAKLALRWHWRIDGVATNGSERDLKTFDHAARVFVAFETFIGPPRTLNYFWGNVEKPGMMLEHPTTSRAKMFVVESGNAKAGQWLTEERDVTADWRQAFPNKTMPKIVAIGMLTDGDSLITKLSGDYAEIKLIAE